MSDKPRNLDSLIPEDLKNSGYANIKDIFGVTITVHACEFSKRNDSWRATFTVSREGEAKKTFISTGAIQPMKIGKYLVQNKLFPMQAKFITQGQAVLLVDPSKEWTPETSDNLPDF